MSGVRSEKESPNGAYRARRFVLRFDRGGVHSFDVLEGEDPVEVLKRHLGFFPSKVPEALQEQLYDPDHPHRFRYEDRGELLALVKGSPASEEEGKLPMG
jgi:hypothetical protein